MDGEEKEGDSKEGERRVAVSEGREWGEEVAGREGRGSREAWRKGDQKKERKEENEKEME